MKKKIKLRDMTEEQYRGLVWDDSYCRLLPCEKCIFYNVSCHIITSNCWVNHKDLYSDKFLDQEVEIDVPDILTEEEKAYLSAVIKPWRNKVVDICKINHLSFDDVNEYIYITIEDQGLMSFPYFCKGTMYKGMELRKQYTLEELGL
jgi:hypothetical protein